MSVEILEVGCEGECLVFPIGQTEQRTDSDTAEASGVCAFRTIQTPVEFFLRTGGVESLVGFATVGFLIDDQTLGSMRTISAY